MPGRQVALVSDVRRVVLDLEARKPTATSVMNAERQERLRENLERRVEALDPGLRDVFSLLLQLKGA